MEKKYLAAGQHVPLSLQIRDRNEKLICVANVLDTQDKLIEAVGLEHKTLGLYSNYSFKMPEIEFITVQYVIDDELYETVTERFYLREVEIVKETVVVGGNQTVDTNTLSNNGWFVGIEQ